MNFAEELGDGKFLRTTGQAVATFRAGIGKTAGKPGSDRIYHIVAIAHELPHVISFPHVTKAQHLRDVDRFGTRQAFLAESAVLATLLSEGFGCLVHAGFDAGKPGIPARRHP